jgi:hypothetical protein
VEIAYGIRDDISSVILVAHDDGSVDAFTDLGLPDT